MEKLLFLLLFISFEGYSQNTNNYQSFSAIVSNSFALSDAENKVIPPKKEGDFNLQFSPESIKVLISTSIGKKLSYLIYNSRGETLLANSIKLRSNQRELEIFFPNEMKNGYYYLQLISDKLNKRERFYYKGG